MPDRRRTPVHSIGDDLPLPRRRGRPVLFWLALAALVSLPAAYGSLILYLLRSDS